MASSRSLKVEGPLAGARLDAWITRQLPELSRARVQALMAAGAVRLGGRPVRPSARLRGGEEVMVELPDPVAATPAPEDVPLAVVYEDARLLVVDKPAGMTVHPGAGRLSGTLVNALLHHVRDLSGVGGVLRPGIVHRLDRGTSGLMVVAKDDATMVALGADFKVHRILRRYEALVVGQPPEQSGRIETLHGRDPHDRKKFSIKVKSGRKAITSWRLLERLPGAARLEAELSTGRTHQVRLHLSGLGCPILGDATYGRPPRDLQLRELGRELGRQALHAKTLGFHHPATGAFLEFHSPLPADMQRALDQLRERKS